MFCSNCGARLDEGTIFCPKCGTKVEEGDSQISHNPSSSKSENDNTALYAVGDSDDISRYASFWQRAGAYIIDIIIVNVIAIIIVIFLALLGSTGMLEDDESANLLGFAIAWLYFATQESSSVQATFGKRILGLKVTDRHYRGIGFGRATGRFFSKIVSALILLMGFIMVLFTKKRQGLHDMIAGTYVLSK